MQSDVLFVSLLKSSDSLGHIGQLFGRTNTQGCLIS